MPIPSRIKRIYNPDDKDLPMESRQYVDLRIIDKLDVTTRTPVLTFNRNESDPSRRSQYQKITFEFKNNADVDSNTRKVDVKKITHKQGKLADGKTPDPNDSNDDGQFLVVEQLKGTTTKTGSGLKFQRTHNEYNPFDPDDDDKPTTRKFHRRKVYHIDPDGTVDTNVWIELKRWEQLTATTINKDGQYQKQIYEVKWDDKTWNDTLLRDPPEKITDLGTFDAWTEKPPDEERPHDDLLDPPWRLDPLQQIVNVQWTGAVEFPVPPATLIPQRMWRPNCEAPSTAKMTIAMWARIPRDELEALPENGAIPLIQFGPPAPIVLNYSTRAPAIADAQLERSSIYVQKNEQGHFIVGIRLVSEPLHQSIGSNGPPYPLSVNYHTAELSCGVPTVADPAFHFGSRPAWWWRDMTFFWDYAGHTYQSSPVSWAENGDMVAPFYSGTVPPSGSMTCRFHVEKFGPYESDPLWVQMALCYRAQPYVDAARNYEGPRPDSARLDAPFVPDAWNCILISADVSEKLDINVPPFSQTNIGFVDQIIGLPNYDFAHKLTVNVNNVDFSPVHHYFDFFYATDPDLNQENSKEPGTILPQRFPQSLPPGQGYPDSFLSPPAFLWHGQDTDNNPIVDINRSDDINAMPAGFQDMTIEPWKIAVHGFELAIPTQTSPQLDLQPDGFEGIWVPCHEKYGTVELAAMSIWLDKAIDFTEPNNVDSFVDILDNSFVSPKRKGFTSHTAVGDIVRPPGAHIAFGTPDFYFNGGKAAFPKNRGTALPQPPNPKFDATPDIKNFSPYPKKAGVVVKKQGAKP